MSPAAAPGVAARPLAPLRALLEAAVDYAGLFPPAALEMSGAARNYDQYLGGPDAWMLGRFVVPAARLHELLAARAAAARPRPWHVSALVDPASIVEDLGRIQAARDADSGLHVDSLETRAGATLDGPAIARLAREIGDAFELFVEIPIDTEPEPLLSAIAAARVCAKVRTGGTTGDAFPRTSDLARFLCRCAGHRVPFKATAGLHHPMRGRYRLTYEPASATGMMFGFLSVFTAAALAREGASESELCRILEADHPSAVAVDDSGIACGAARLSTKDVRDARRELVRSFGSCSFVEPVQDLRALGLL